MDGKKESKAEKKMNMTTLSKEAFSNATEIIRSAEDAAGYLQDQLITRNIRSNLLKYSKEKDPKALQKLLTAGLLANKEGRIKASEERRVRGWMNPDSTRSLKKADAIETAFILGLSTDEAEAFVAAIAEEKLHLRDVEEIVYYYGLEHGLSFRDCDEILHRDEVIQIIQNVKELPYEELEAEEAYTEFIQQDLEDIDGVDELLEFLQENQTRFGAFHNTAYDMFMEMITKLEEPDKMEEELHILEEKAAHYTVRDILNEYFYPDLVLTARNRAVKSKKAAKKEQLPPEQQFILNLIQKEIVDGWPDEVSISKMKNRRMDVTRKSLILLFLATDGEYEDPLDYAYECDLTQEDLLEDLIGRLNDMLFFCGFRPLDPRNPFDWLILFCMAVDDLFDIDPKIREVLEELF